VDDFFLDENAIEELKQHTVAALRAADGDRQAIRKVIYAYIVEGYRMNLVGGELIDFLCADTPNIVETAGYMDEKGIEVVEIFDELHVQFRRTRS
jgi:hypothetical protein